MSDVETGRPGDVGSRGGGGGLDDRDVRDVGFVGVDLEGSPRQRRSGVGGSRFFLPPTTSTASSSSSIANARELPPPVPLDEDGGAGSAGVDDGTLLELRSSTSSLPFPAASLSSSPSVGVGGAGGGPSRRTTKSTAVGRGERSAAAAATDRKRKKKKKKAATTTSGGFSARDELVKKGSLMLLVGQMVGLVLLMRYSRTRGGGGDMYLASTAVFNMEITKFVMCLVVIFLQSGSTLASFRSTMRRHVWESPSEIVKLSVPSSLYAIQNNLLYAALTNLDAATYQVCYQTKILTTALFSVVLLQRRLSKRKWTSLVILTIGVAFVQLSGSSDRPHAVAAAAEAATEQNRLVGLVAVLCASCTSGFAGVYFERVLKGTPSTSLWMRNVQMGLTSLVVAYFTVRWKDSEAVSKHGFYSGYDLLVWTVIFVQAIGGLIVAVVVRYADNILKGFASSFSIVVSCVVSTMLFDFRPNGKFLFGAFLVILSGAMYSRPEDRTARKKKKRSTTSKTILPLTTTDGGKS